MKSSGLSFVDFFFKRSNRTHSISSDLAYQRSATLSDITNDSQSFEIVSSGQSVLEAGKLKLDTKRRGIFSGGSVDGSVDTRKYAEITDAEDANSVSNYYFSTTASRYSNTPFSV